MAYTHVSRLTTTSSDTFDTLEAWLDAHGSCGQLSEGHTSWSAVLDEGGTSITRTSARSSVAVAASQRDRSH